MRQADWALAYRETSSWRRDYGSGGVPVPLVAASQDMREVCRLLDDLLDGQTRHVLVHGPPGSGKSSIVSAAQAALSDAGIEYRQVLPSDDYRGLMERLAKPVDALILIDDCGRLPAPTFRRLVQLRDRCRRGMLLTATKVPSDTSILLDGERDHYIRLSPIEDRPEDLLLLGSLMWERMAGANSDLAASCDDTVVETFLNAPYPNGARSLEDALSMIYSLLDSDAQLDADSLPMRLSYYDVTQIFMRQAREALTAPRAEPTRAILVVEGDTDVIYLRHAAQVAEEKNGWRLLDGLDIQAAGSGREGGGRAVVQRVSELWRGGTAALGLFDHDLSGREAFDLAHRQNLDRLLLPTKFDPLSRDDMEARVEIEDLLPVDMVARFYSLHPELSPEEKHWRLGRWRIVPRGADKYELAMWVIEVASFEDMERFIFVIGQVRDRLKLPSPEGMPAKSALLRLVHEPASEWLNRNLP